MNTKRKSTSNYLPVERTEDEIKAESEIAQLNLLYELYDLRKNICKLSLHEASLLTDQSRSTIKSYENGKRIPSLSTYCKIKISYLTFAMDNHIPLPEKYILFWKLLKGKDTLDTPKPENKQENHQQTNKE